MTTSLRELASVDGTISPTGEAMVPLKDDGLYRGDGAFEVIRLYEGKPFALVDHLDRLRALRCGDRARVRPLRAGAGDRGPARRVRRRRRAAAADRHPRRPPPRDDRADPRPRARPFSIATVTYCPSVILNGVKSLSYAANMQATRLAKAQGADEAVLVKPDGIVLEPPTSSIFWVSPQGALRTPALDNGVLESITRDRLVKALHVEEGAWPVADLRAAHEAFLASTTREIQAVSAIDGVELASAPGPRTREAQDAFGATLGRTELDEQADGLPVDRRAALDLRNGARIRRQGDRPTGARERPRRPLRPRAGEQAGRGRLPRRAGRRGVRRPRPRLHRLRADRRAGRPRRLLRPHRRLGADLARRRLDRAVGHRGAEAALAAAALLRRGARLLRPDRARHRLRRRQPAHPRDQDRRRLVDQRPEDVDLARQLLRGGADLRPDRPREEAQGPRLLPRPRRQRGLHHAGDPRQARPALLRHRRDLARLGRGRRGRDAAARSATASRSR